jgi:hypothetical protein
MKLSEKVQVSDRFQRSIRIDTDIGDESVINSFVCPQSSAEVLLSMARGRQQVGEAGFTWTGPYGSGKSSLVVALNALLGKESRLRAKASKAIGSENAEFILKSFSATGKKGWTFVPIVGRKVNITDVLIHALKEATGTSKKISSDNLLEAVKDLAEKEDCGLFIVIDEMGKFLEGAAEGVSDIHLFQELAELAVRSNGKIVILGILHQAFAEYARRLSRDIRDEWSKIQGRFIDLPLNVAGEELIELISRAIKSNIKPEKPTRFAKITAKHIAMWRPIHTDNFSVSLSQCWPLHPVTASLLGPISRRRFGQNQRSVFGFLNSAEPYGFSAFLKNTLFNDDILYVPAQLWDYLRANLEPSIMASSDGHKWSLAVDAISRAEAFSTDPKAVEVIKCIALMDLFQERSGLVPEAELLAICVDNLSNKGLEEILSSLERQSIIRYKKHKKAYSLYEGSDFDISTSVEEAFEQIPTLDFNRIRQAARFQPIVAKKHYHETGALRWFEVDLVPSEQALKVAETYQPVDGSIGLVMIVLGDDGETTPIDIEKICRKASGINQEWPVFVSSAENSWLIRSHAKELQALEWIKNNNLALGGDTVARREVENRLAEIKDKLEEYLSTTLSSAKWFIDGKAAAPLTFKELHSWASEKADLLYGETPRINSELINRIKPSSNSGSALKTLLKAMAERQGQDRLGIEGYPAEGGLFETLLAKTGLYDRKTLSFKAPTAKNDSFRLLPLWDAADHFFKTNKHRSTPITELYRLWSGKPYGVKDGLLPFFAMAYLMTRSQDYAVYREGTYRPSIDGLFIDYLTKSPKDIALRAMNFSVIGKKILAGVTKTLNRIHMDKQPLSEISPPLEIARSLVSTVMDLHPWVLRTRQISSNAIKIRELIKNANDPNKVLFDDLPNLFKEHEASLNRGDVQPIITEVDRSLEELVELYPKLMNSFRLQLIEELQIEAKGTLGFKEINIRAKNIMQLSGDFKLDAFAARLSTYQNSDIDIEGLTSLAADKPTRDWIDLDVNRARLRIAEMSQQFNHIEAYGRVQNREDYRQAVSFMARLDGKPRTYVHEFTVKQPQQKIVQDLESKLHDLLSKHKNLNNDILLAALANVGARILEQDERKVKQKKVHA